ncbi:MAG TPA: response regulator, partial [Verrucomicrobiae bacterium]|nr:response regulator [Verrucomicrobiae bacterium]
IMNPNPEQSHSRILVVDDNPSIHEDFRKILCCKTSESSSSIGTLVEEVFGDRFEPRAEAIFEMESAFQGQEALSKVQAAESEGRPFSLAFVDVRMPPGWDGVETVKHIWKEFPHIQVVMCTAYSDYSWEQILRSLGRTDSLVILKKPFDNVEVLQLAHTLTEKWVLTQKAAARMADLDRLVLQRTQELVDANQKLHDEVERRGAVEAALRESEERFRLAFDTVAVPVALCELESGRCLDVNQSFLALTGYEKGEILQHALGSLSVMVDPARFGNLIEDLSRGRRVHNEEVTIRTRGGSVRQTLACVELLKLGARTCWLGAFQDVTEQRKLESQLRQAQKMEAVGQLAAGVAHDFNNLLTIIHGYASLQLAKTTLETDVAKAFTQVKAASERAAALTRQLLSFSRQQIMQRKPLEIGAAINRTQAMLSRTLGETIQLECSSSPNLPWIQADETSLDQVIMNLAVNARDAMPNGGKVTISAERAIFTREQVSSDSGRRAGDFVVLSVIDNGCGMDAQTLCRIFEPFFTTKPIGRGTGLGLSTVYGILKQHEGWVEVDSALGRGTTFRAYFPSITVTPRRDRSASGPKAPKLADSPAQGDSILVVEDEPEVLEFVTMALEEEGYRVVHAASGREALSKWSSISGKIQLLLTDVVMPGGLNGNKLADELIKLKPGLRVIYTSGYTQESLLGEKTDPSFSVLPKPFTHEALVAAVRAALGAPVLPVASVCLANQVPVRV